MKEEESTAIDYNYLRYGTHGARIRISNSGVSRNCVSCGAGSLEISEARFFVFNGLEIALETTQFHTILAQNQHRRGKFRQYSVIIIIPKNYCRPGYDT